MILSRIYTVQYCIITVLVASINFNDNRKVHLFLKKKKKLDVLIKVLLLIVL